jgi:glycosyltransferase involved in cell wall biosynthesis
MSVTEEPLYVVLVLSNPVRFDRRAKLFLEAAQRVRDAGAIPVIAEATFGNRDFEVAEPNNPFHIRVRVDHEIWLKEPLINRAVQALPYDWKYVVVMDADIQFMRPDWVEETKQALQHWKVVQPFSHCDDMGPEYERIETHSGFCYNWNRGLTPMSGYNSFFHPGFCWAWRREAWDAVGGMIDRAVCGAGDHHMALAMVGMANRSLPGGVHPNYRKMVLDWEKRAEKFIQRDIGHVAGLIVHHFHGWKPDRNYEGRWTIITSNQYDPETDLVRDSQGMYQLAPGKPQLRDQLRRYFRMRNEDAGPKTWPVDGK